jgi:hypothetical protein
MNKQLAAATASVLFLGYSAAAVAGLTYTQTTTSDGTRVSVQKVSIDGNNAKMENVEVAFDNPFMPRGSYVLMRGGPSDMYLVNPAQRSYARFDTEMFTQMAASMQGMVGQIQFKNVSVEKLVDEPGETIAGYPTRHYRYKASWTMQPGQMPMSVETTLEQDVWTTTAFVVPSITGESVAGLPAQVAEQAQIDMEGFPLRQISTQSTKTSMGGVGGGMLSRMMNRAGGNAPVKTTIEVSDISEVDVPADTFELPAGYSETSLLQSGPAMPNLNNVGERPPVPNLNDLR